MSSDHHDHEPVQHERASEDGVDERVAPIELFFDLVFVFAITQVTRLFEEDLTWMGMARGLAVLAVLWWAWAAYAWLTNAIRPDDAFARLVLLGAMVAMLIAGCAVPHAFDKWSIVFGVAYLVVRLLHVTIYLLATRGNPNMFRAVAKLVPNMTIAGTLIFVAGFAAEGPLRATLWALAIAIDVAGPLLNFDDGWQISPGHFAERHGLVVIIALGESVINIGLGVTQTGLTGLAITTAVFALVVVSALWWMYFDVVAIVAERRLTALSGRSRAALARDSYTYLHFPLIAGIVLFALGTREVLLHADYALEIVPRTALLGGVAMYLLGHVAFRLRNTRSLSVVRTLLGVALLMAIPLTGEVEGVYVIAGMALALAVGVAYESVRYREARHDVREHEAGGDWVRESPWKLAP